jgi:hypothetical protein
MADKNTDCVAPSEPGPLLMFSLNYINGFMVGESEEVRRHWKRIYAHVYGMTAPASAAPSQDSLQPRPTAILDVGFKYLDGVHIPTVLVGFAPSDYDTRDAFARALRKQMEDQQ